MAENGERVAPKLFTSTRTFFSSPVNNRAQITSASNTDDTSMEHYAIDGESTQRPNKRTKQNSPATTEQFDTSVTPMSVTGSTPTSTRETDVINRRFDEMVGMMHSMRAEAREEMQEMREEAREEMQEWREESSGFLKQMKEELRAEMRQVVDIVEAVSTRMDESDFRLDKLEAAVQTKSSALDAINRGMNHFDRRAECMEQKLIDFDSKARRANLMFYGVQERGVNEDCASLVGELAKMCGIDKPGITNAYRIGRPRQDSRTPRAICASFMNQDQRQTMKKQRRSLPREVAVADDLPEAVREARKLILEDMKRAKQAKKEAWLSYPAKLIVNNVLVKSVDIVTHEITVHDNQYTSAHQGRSPTRGASENSGADRGGATGQTRSGDLGFGLGRGIGRGVAGDRGESAETVADQSRPGDVGSGLGRGRGGAGVRGTNVGTVAAGRGRGRSNTSAWSKA